jgi:restriction endonuclease S subunit
MPTILKTDNVFTCYKTYKHKMATVEAFKSVIDKTRNILRLHTPSIVNEQSSNHICLYILARCLTIKKCRELKIPLDFAWENIVKQFSNVEGGKQRGYDLFYSPTEECFIKHVDALFETSSEDYPFKVKELEKHKQIVELIDKIDMESIDLGVDAFGFVYEDELSHSKGARKNGEHFTDRKICNYMTKLVNPRVNADGVPESVCDPSMGTGGFLFTYQKFFKDAKIDVNWNIHKHRIYGQDVINSSVCKAKMNLYVNTNMVCENLVLRNSLTNDLQNTSVDIILANMPFGLKGLKYKDCCQRVKDLKIDGTKSEPLFLQLMMVSLNRGGRCAVVVPDGMLVNNSKLHDETRKYLLDNFELKRVIKMKGQFFINTGIQPSILFFENTGKPTSVVEFWDVIKGANGDIEETMVLSVPRAKFDASCSFDMRLYQEVKAVVNPAGFPMVNLRDLYVQPTKLDKFNAGDMDNLGTIPFYSAKWNSPTGYHSKASYNSSDPYFVVIKSGGGDHSSSTVGLGMFFDVKGEIATSVHTMILTKITDCKYQFHHKYIYYYMKNNICKLRDKAKKSVNLEVLSIDAILGFEIILPPIETQQEIVATIDRIYAPGTTELAETLKLTDKAMDLILANPGGASLEPIVEAQRLMRKSAQMVADVKAQMVADVKAQMVAIMKSVNMRGFPMITISNICSMMIGGTPLRSKNEYYENGEHVWVSVRELNNNIITDSKEYLNNEGVKNSNVKLVKKGSILMSFKMSIGKCAIAGIDLYTNEAIVAWYSNNETILSNQYLYYYLSTQDFSNSGKGSIGVGSMNKGSLSELTMHLPPIEFQESMISRMNALQTQLTSLENLGKQAEDNARFILDSYI